MCKKVRDYAPYNFRITSKKILQKKGVIIVIYGEAAKPRTLRVLQLLFQFQELQIAVTLLLVLLFE